MIRKSILNLNLASAVVALTSRPEPVGDEGTKPRPTIESVCKPASFYADRMMRQWEDEDRRRKEAMQSLTLHISPTVATEDRWVIDAKEVVNDPNCGTKNVSPYRAQRRREKNKAARKARRQNRKK
jgi:hypothetical protein